MHQARPNGRRDRPGRPARLMAVAAALCLCLALIASCTGGLSLAARAKLAAANLADAGFEGRVVEGISFGTHDLALDLYRPSGPASEDGFTVVVFWHGGSWQTGHRGQYRFVGAALAEAGLMAVIPDYRKYPEVTFPAFMEDAAQAVAWARTSVADYGGDPDGLRLMGHSAGAHIAALLAADARYLRAAGMDTTALSGVAGLSGPYHFTPEEPDIKGIFGPPERYPLMQVSRHVNAATPPMLMLRGTDDETVGAVNAERLSRALRAAGVAHTVRHVPGLDHVGPIAEFVRTRRGESAVVRMVVDFLSDATAVTSIH